MYRRVARKERRNGTNGLKARSWSSKRDGVKRGESFPNLKFPNKPFDSIHMGVTKLYSNVG